MFIVMTSFYSIVKNCHVVCSFVEYRHSCSSDTTNKHYTGQTNILIEQAELDETILLIPRMLCIELYIQEI